MDAESFTMYCEMRSAFRRNPLPWHVDDSTGRTVDANECEVPRGEGVSIEAAKHLVRQINKMAP